MMASRPPRRQRGGWTPAWLSRAGLLPCLLVLALFLTDAVSGEVARVPVWTRLPGTARDLAINGIGQAYALSPEGQPLRWDVALQRWRRLSGQFVRIAAAEDNHPWAVDGNGVVFRFNGLWWEDKAEKVADVAADARGNVYVAGRDGAIRQWNPMRGEWRPVEGGQGHRVALDARGRPWTVTGDGRIRAFDGKTWRDLPGRAVDIAVGGSGAVVIADFEGFPRSWNRAAGEWTLLPGTSGVTGVAVAPDGGPWVVTRDGTILATTLLVAPTRIQTEEGQAPGIQAPGIQASEAHAPRAQAAPLRAPDPSAALPATASAVESAPLVATVPTAATARPTPVAVAAATDAFPAAASSRLIPEASKTAALPPRAVSVDSDGIAFRETGDRADRLAIGADGSVFALDSQGNILQWSNIHREFAAFPGTLLRLAVDPDGHPWGISPLGRVFYHTGHEWRQVPDAVGADLSIGADGTVILADARGNLFRLNDQKSRFLPHPGVGFQVAVAPDGSLWTLDGEARVRHCAALPCTVFPQRAASLAVGPEGSVFMVTTDQQLMRLDKGSQTFKRVGMNLPGHRPIRVAVGPQGYPWVVSGDNQVLASLFFDRDEQRDRALASASSGDTQGSGATAPLATAVVSGFVFSKNISFETIATDTLSPGSGATLAGGNDGNVWAYNIGGGLHRYVSQQDRFVRQSNWLDDNFYFLETFDIASNGDLWAVTNNPLNQVLRLRNNQVTDFTVPGLSPTYSPTFVAVAPDDTIYAVYSNGRLYKKAPSASSFSTFSKDTDVLKVAVGPDNDVWILDTSNRVQRWSGTRFENQPPGKTQLASHIDVGKEGTLYLTNSSNELLKWNAANESFDQARSVTATTVAVESDGRPWINVDNVPTVRRARD